MADEPLSASAAWRAKELRRRVKNRRAAAQSLLANARSVEYAWTVPPLSTTSTSSADSASVATSAPRVRLSAPSVQSHSSCSSLDAPLSISIPSGSPTRSNRQRTAASPSDTALSSSLSLPQLWRAKQDVHATRLDITDMQIKQAASLRACDQQFQIERSVRELKSDLSVVQRTVREKTDTLDALQRRVLRLAHTLRAPASGAPDEQHFASSRLEQLERIRQQQNSTQPCAACGQHFVQHVLAAHEAACAERSARAQLLAQPSSSSTSFSPLSKSPHSCEPQPKSVNQLADVLHQCQQLPCSSSGLRLLTPAAADDDAPADVADDTPRMKPRAQPRFVSQPPRNLRVVAASITHNAVLLQWDPPIFTGATPIVDYELQYARCVSGGAFEPLPSQTTSRWCLQAPVASNEFWLRDLEADSEYGELTLCAVTQNGTSAPSNRVERVRTAPARPPSAPYFLTTGAVTATSISLGWQEPLDDGGTPIEFYELVFSEAVLQDAAAATHRASSTDSYLDVSTVVYKQRRVRTTSQAPTLTLTSLLSGQEHRDLHVRAVNTAGLPGAFSAAIASVVTIAPGSAFKLLDELHAAVNSRARVVDSAFLSGFMQRYERREYIRQVARFIVALHPELADRVELILQRTSATELSAEITSDDPSTDTLETLSLTSQRTQFDNLPPHEKIRERRRQFHFRIAELTQRLDDATYNVQWSKDRRVDLVALIRSAESRIVDKQAELARARMFTGPQMDSDVLESGLQRFYTKDLVLALEDEIAIEQLYIADAKSESVRVDDGLRADEQMRDTLAQQLATRRAALEAFEREPNGVADALAEATDVRVASLARLRQGVLFRTFSALAAHRTAAREQRRKVRTTLTRLLAYHTRAAFRHWVCVVRTVLRRTEDAEAPRSSNAHGIGSLGLVNATLDRDALVLQSQKLLLQLRATGGDLEQLAWTREQQIEQLRVAERRAEEDAHAKAALLHAPHGKHSYHAVVLEADAKMDVGDFGAARRLYEYVLQDAQTLANMPSAQLTQLQLQLGRAHVQLQSHEQALASLNRASFLAARIGDRAREGEALLLLAQTHVALRSVRLAVEHFDRALVCFEAVSDQRGQVSSFRGLENAYARLENAEMATQCRTQADDLEFALAHKLAGAGAALAGLQQRLVGAGAESSLEITLERVGAIVPRLRTQRIQCKLDMGEHTKLVASLESLLADKRALLVQGETDLKRALASDSTQVDSSVLSGSSARYELADFTAKLAKLMGSVRAGEAHVAKEIANAKIRIRNCEDEVAELERELQVETGDLMRQMRSKAALRCFCFNATNAALQCVVGTASHGVTTCVAASELATGLFDLLTGVCLGQAVGDPLRQHLGPPMGHQAPIVALYYTGTRIYTGGMDAALGVWDVQDAAVGGGYTVALVRMLLDFDAAVVSVTADLELVVCGCADCDVFVFDATTLAVVARLVAAHDRSVGALAVDSMRQWVITASADTRVRVWELGARSPHTTYRRVTLRQSLGTDPRAVAAVGAAAAVVVGAHTHAVTCVKQVASEIVSGDANGRVVLWHLDAASASKLLRSCDVHSGVAIQCLDFDATRIVTGAIDGRVCATDVATGQLLQTLLGHTASVLDLQFDRQRLVTMAADGRVRLWYWQSRIGATGASGKKFHILGAGETLKALSLKYHVSTRELLTWNRLGDSSQLYLGQKLVVGVNSHSGVAADELATLDTAVSRVFGKLSSENLAFAAANKAKSADVEAQWAARKLAMLAKEYFPPVTDGDNDDDDDGKDADSSDESSDSDIPIGSDDEQHQGDS